MSLLPSWPTVVAGLVIGAALGGGIDHLWMSHKVVAAEKRYDKLKDDGEKALALANAANQKQSIELQDRVDTLNTQKVLDDEKAAKNLESVRAAARAGNVGLSIRGACRTNSPSQTSTVGKSSAEERTDLLPGTVDDILRIAGHAAQDVRDYNDLLDQYNAVCK